jgi:hypothetical protein
LAYSDARAGYLALHDALAARIVSHPGVEVAPDVADDLAGELLELTMAAVAAHLRQLAGHV